MRTSVRWCVVLIKVDMLNMQSVENYFLVW